MGSRDVPYDEEAVCDGCGIVGAYDFMGDILCVTCAEVYESDAQELLPREDKKE